MAAGVCGLSGATVRADMMPGTLQTGPSGHVDTIDRAAALSLSDSDIVSNGWNTLVVSKMQYVGFLPWNRGFEAPENRSFQDTRQLPAGFDSASLFIIGVSGLGAFHLFHSTKRYSFARLPVWFHSDSRTRIGRTYVVELDIEGLPICHSNKLAVQHLILPHAPLLPRPCHPARYFLAEEPPRGPPLSLLPMAAVVPDWVTLRGTV